MTRHGSFPTPDHEAGSERAPSMNPPAFGDGLPRTILGRGASAFEERSRALVRDHFDFIWRLLRRTGLSPQDADDEAQRVFITVAQKLDQVVAGNERTYLYGTALRFAANFGARRGVASAITRRPRTSSSRPATTTSLAASRRKTCSTACSRRCLRRSPE